ncbi:MAG: hypothetical protein Tsb006_6700 [Rickettsiaceae bacterium]
MKTNNLEMDLMVPSQLNKDIVFNESMLKIDSFINLSINGFVESLPDDIETGKKYIITQGEHANQICYRPVDSKPILLHQPKQGMIVALVQDRNFLIFDGLSWQEYSGGIKPTAENFTGVNDSFILPPNEKYHYLYLNSNTDLNIESSSYPEISIIIKQSNTNSYKLTWSPNILWENAAIHKMTTTKNAIDFIKLYRLPETPHFLAKIIAQNFNY